MLTYQNILVLRHFRHCRALEPSQKGKRPRFHYVAFYKETFQQSLQLFSPLRTSRQSATEDCKNEISQKAPIATLPPVFHLRPEEHLTPLLRPTRKKGWCRIQAGSCGYDKLRIVSAGSGKVSGKSAGSEPKFVPYVAKNKQSSFVSNTELPPQLRRHCSSH